MKAFSIVECEVSSGEGADLHYASYLSINPTRQSWNVRALGGKKPELSSNTSLISQMASIGKYTSSTPALSTNASAPAASTSFQKTFIARVPNECSDLSFEENDDFVVAECWLLLKRKDGDKTHKLIDEIAEWVLEVEDPHGLDEEGVHWAEYEPSEDWRERLHFDGSRISRDVHWAEMIARTCVVITEDRVGDAGEQSRE